MVARPNPKMPESDEVFLQLLEEHGGVTYLATALGVPQSTVSVRKSRIVKKNGGVTLRQPTYPKAPDWGLGGPILVPSTKAYGDETVVGLFDIHWPHHDKEMFEAVLRLLEELQPDVVVIGGDAIDLSNLSRWEEKQRQKVAPGVLYKRVKDDLSRWREEIMLPIREACPNAVIRYIEGNHDERLRMWLMGDQSVDGVEMAKEWMGLDDLGVIWHPRCGFKLRKHFLIRHGEVLSIHSAKVEQEKTRCGGWIGHGHRRRTWYEEYPEVEEAYQTHMAPVMCRRDYDYGAGGAGLAPWPQGILVGTFDTQDEFDYEIEVARWWKGTLLFRGRRY